MLLLFVEIQYSNRRLFEAMISQREFISFLRDWIYENRVNT